MMHKHTTRILTYLYTHTHTHTLMEFSERRVLYLRFGPRIQTYHIGGIEETSQQNKKYYTTHELKSSRTIFLKCDSSSVLHVWTLNTSVDTNMSTTRTNQLIWYYFGKVATIESASHN